MSFLRNTSSQRVFTECIEWATAVPVFPEISPRMMMMIIILPFPKFNTIFHPSFVMFGWSCFPVRVDFPIKVDTRTIPPPFSSVIKTIKPIIRRWKNVIDNNITYANLFSPCLCCHLFFVMVPFINEANIWVALLLPSCYIFPLEIN